MAELVLKIGSGSNYEDGDIVEAFSRRRIQCCHAELICNADAPFNRDGLRADGSMFEALYERTHRFKFERVGEKVVRRIDRQEIKVETFNEPNLLEWLARRRQSPTHNIFGATGVEIWYGHPKLSPANIDLVWSDIENMSDKREADHRHSPMNGRYDLRHFFAVSVTDMSDAEAQDARAPKMNITFDDDGGEIREILRKRKNYVDYAALVSGATVDKIRDRDALVDTRSNINPRSIIQAR